MNKLEKNMLHAILDKNQESTLSHFEAWANSIHFDEIEGGSYRLVPLLYKKVSNLQADFPLKSRMKGVYRYFLFDNQMLMHKSMDVLEALQEAKIDYMLLKGAALIASYYESPALRPMNDLDILIKREDAHRTFELLNAMGWENPFGRIFQQSFQTTYSYALRKPNQIELDLHWNVIYQVAWEGSEQAYWQEGESAQFANHTVSILKPEMQLLHNLAHGLRYNALSAIRWIPDVMLIIEKRKDDFDWNHLLALAQERRLVYTLRYGMVLLAEEFGAEIPESFMTDLKAIPISKAEKKLHQVMNERSRFSMFKAHWQIYMISSANKPYWKRMMGLPYYLKSLIACETYREAFTFIMRKLVKHAKKPAKKISEPET